MYESGEMYLETILVLSKKQNTVRAIDIVDYMGYSKPSVSRALSKLKASDFITVDEKNGHIELTSSGRSIAEKIYERHIVISGLLVSIGVSEATALKDACKIEHDISDETFDAMKRAIKQR